MSCRKDRSMSTSFSPSLEPLAPPGGDGASFVAPRCHHDAVTLDGELVDVDETTVATTINEGGLYLERLAIIPLPILAASRFVIGFLHRRLPFATAFRSSFTWAARPSAVHHCSACGRLRVDVVTSNSCPNLSCVTTQNRPLSDLTLYVFITQPSFHKDAPNPHSAEYKQLRAQTIRVFDPICGDYIYHKQSQHFLGCGRHHKQPRPNLARSRF